MKFSLICKHELRNRFDGHSLVEEYISEFEHQDGEEGWVEWFKDKGASSKTPVLLRIELFEDFLRYAGDHSSWYK